MCKPFSFWLTKRKYGKYYEFLNYKNLNIISCSPIISFCFADFYFFILRKTSIKSTYTLFLRELILKNKSTLGIVLTSGFAMFSMFFGSGNLVFPVQVGIEAQSSFLFSILGFVLTGVCLPFLGLVGIMQFEGDRHRYFSKLTPIPAFMLTLLMLSLMGPLGIIPRCASVSFGGFISLFPSTPLWVFNAAFILVIAALIWQRNRIVEIIGVYLTPIKLGSFILLIIIGVYFANRPLDAGLDPIHCLTQGVKKGYQTMDLIASFFFGSAIYEYIRSHVNPDLPLEQKKSLLLSLGIKASIVGGSLLALCYVGLVILGAKYAPILAGIKQESYLMVIAKETLGNYAVAFVAMTLIVSCLATATITASIFADFMQEDVTRNKMNRKIAIIFTLALAYSLSLLGFEGICKFLESILEWVYPFLMIFALYQMVCYFQTREKNNISI